MDGLKEGRERDGLKEGREGWKEGMNEAEEEGDM